MAKHREKSSTGSSRHVVLGRRGGSPQEGFARRGDDRNNEGGERRGGRDHGGRDHHRGGRRDERTSRNRDEARVEREPAEPTAVDNGAAIAVVLAQLAKMPEGATAYQLAQVLGEESREVGAIVRRLVEKGQVLEVKPGRYQVSGTGGEFPAVLEEETIPGSAPVLRARLPDGVVKTVNPRYTIGAKAGDVVQVVLGEDGLALVTRLLRRVGREVVGTIQFKPDGAYLVCDNRREGLLKIVDAFSSFEDDYRVGNRYVGVIQMDSRGDAGVRIDRLLGKESPEVTDFSYVCLAHDLPGDFPPEVVAEAEAFPKRFVLGTGKQKREDLRESLVFTIDPATAKDFDDAISLTYDEDGHWVLGVHIADVSHYVAEGGAIDTEAVARGTSCYLINRVIPMLPEVLSNGLCSLVPNEPRYCLSAFLTLDRQGKLLHTRLAETLINSRHRFTYEEAMDVLVDRDVKGKWPDDVRTVVKEVGTIAQILRRNRERAGALNLFSVEHRFRLDVNGIPVEIIGETSDASHQLIEECMLLANRAVAEWLEQQKYPCVYRLHQEPDAERLAQFASVLEVYGIDSTQVFNRFGLQKLLGNLAKEPPAARKVLNYLCLRAFKKAVYGVEQLGHYALAFKSYAHFTSPIRRYPDLLVHRLVKRALGLTRYKKVEIRRGYLDALAKQASFLEQRAEQGERDLHARKAARYLAARIGESFPAVVVSAFPGGLSIQLLETGMDGMLPMRELRDDFYTFDPKRLCLVGKRSARVIGCGSELDVVVNTVDIERADIVFGLEARGGQNRAIRPPAVARREATAAPAAAQRPAAGAGATVAAVSTTRPPAVRPAPGAPASPVVRQPFPRTMAAKPTTPAATSPEPEELTPALDEEPVPRPGKPATKRTLSIDTGIDRRRVPERWRSGRTARETPPERDAHPGHQSGNKKKKRR